MRGGVKRVASLYRKLCQSVIQCSQSTWHLLQGALVFDSCRWTVCSLLISRFLCLLSGIICCWVEAMLNYTPKDDCYGSGSNTGACVLFLWEGFYSTKDQEESVQEEHLLVWRSLAPSVVGLLL